MTIPYKDGFYIFSTFPWPEKKEPLTVTNLRKRVSSLLEEDASDIMAGDVPLSDRGNQEHQQKIRRKTMAVPQQDEPPKKGIMAVLRNKLRRTGEPQHEANQLRDSMPIYQDMEYRNDYLTMVGSSDGPSHGDGMNDYYMEHAPSQAYRLEGSSVPQPPSSCATGSTDTVFSGTSYTSEVSSPQEHWHTSPQQQTTLAHSAQDPEIHASNDLYRLQGPSSEILPIHSSPPVSQSTVDTWDIRSQEPTMQSQWSSHERRYENGVASTLVQENQDNIHPEGQQSSSNLSLMHSAQSLDHVPHHAHIYEDRSVPPPAASQASMLSPITEMHQARSNPDKPSPPPRPAHLSNPRKEDSISSLTLAPVSEAHREHIKSRPENHPGKRNSIFSSPEQLNAGMQQVKPKDPSYLQPSVPPNKDPNHSRPPVPPNKPWKTGNAAASTVPSMDPMKSAPKRPPPVPLNISEDFGDSATPPKPQVPNTPRPNQAPRGNTRQAVSFAPDSRLVSNSDIPKTNSMPQMESPKSGDSDVQCLTWPKKPDRLERKLFTPTQKKKAERQTAVMATTLHRIHHGSGYESIREPVVGIRRATDNRGRIRQSQAFCDDQHDYEEVSDL